MEFPMIAFELCGDNGSLKLIIDEVFIDGSGFRGYINIAANNYSVQNSKYYFTLWALSNFKKQLEKCYNELSSSACYNELYDKNLSLNVVFDKYGHVTVFGSYQERFDINNELKFEINLDQTHIQYLIKQIKLIESMFDSYKEKCIKTNNADISGINYTEMVKDKL